jgi:hypothetical protein
MVSNGTFAAGTTGWSQLAPPNNLDLAWEVVAGRFHGKGSSSNRQLYGPGSILNLVTGRLYHWSGNLEVVSGQVNCTLNVNAGQGLHAFGVGEWPVSFSWVSTVTNATTKPVVATYNQAAEFYIDNIEIREFGQMAITSKGFKLVVGLIDAGRDQSNMTFDLVAATYADAVTATNTLLPLLEAVTDAVIKGYSIIENFVEGTLVLPAGTVEVENRAMVVCQINANPLKTATVVIPAATIGLFQSNTGAGHNIIDVTDADLLAYLDIWQVSGALAKLSDGEYLDDTAVIISGKRTHRHSSNG